LMSSGWNMITAIVLGCTAGFLLEKRREREAE